MTSQDLGLGTTLGSNKEPPRDFAGAPPAAAGQRPLRRRLARGAQRVRDRRALLRGGARVAMRHHDASSHLRHIHEYATGALFSEVARASRCAATTHPNIYVTFTTTRPARSSPRWRAPRHTSP